MSNQIQITQEDILAYTQFAKYFYSIRDSYPDIKLTAYFDKINGQPIMVMNKQELGMDKLMLVGKSMTDPQSLALISELKAMVSNSSGRCFVEHYRTSPTYQNQGYGSYLMNIVVQACKDNGTHEIYGQIDPYDEIQNIPEELLEKTNYDEYRAASLYLQQHYQNRGFQVETIITEHTNHRTGQISHSKYVKFFEDPQNMTSTKTYVDGLFDFETNNHCILNYDDLLYAAYENQTRTNPQEQ